jgi:two-component system alkaline phosphatase synthesis response regulator PhoP
MPINRRRRLLDTGQGVVGAMKEMVLVVEDNLDMVAQLKLALEMEGYQVLTATDGQEALRVLERVTPDLIIADIMMPRMNGYELYEATHRDERWLSVPFIFLTAKTDKEDIRLGKEMGADDYLVKPVEKEDLIATIRGKLKRVTELMEAAEAAQEGEGLDLQGTLKTGDLIIDLDRHIVTFKGHPIHLTPTEFDLLACLAHNLDFVVSCQELVERAHGYDCNDESEAREIVRPHIKNLRRKIEPNPNHFIYIVNVRGVGYKLVSHFSL